MNQRVMVQFDQCSPHAPREDCVSRSVTPTNCAITNQRANLPSTSIYAIFRGPFSLLWQPQQWRSVEIPKRLVKADPESPCERET
jgi:hypothetical protein